MTVKVLFVCLGNICRSPTAHGLFQNQVNQANLDKHIIVDSAGTGAWHVGHPPDKRAQSTALERGYDISHLRARSVTTNDFSNFDYILGMDQENFSHLLALKPHNYTGTVGLFLEVANLNIDERQVPDPYYGDQAHFEYALDLIEKGASGLLSRIRTEYEL